jgi:hypothetical protein
MEMVRRAAAAQATLDKFKGKPFHFGSMDCAQLVAFHLRKMGHKPKLAKAGRYSSALGAKKALKRLGYETLAEAMDGNGFERIPPAAAIVGDVIEMPGLEGPGALAVALGNGRAVAYHEDAIGAVVVQPSQMLAAWRVT